METVVEELIGKIKSKEIIDYDRSPYGIIKKMMKIALEINNKVFYVKAYDDDEAFARLLDTKDNCIHICIRADIPTLAEIADWGPEQVYEDSYFVENGDVLTCNHYNKKTFYINRTLLAQEWM